MEGFAPTSMEYVYVITSTRYYPLQMFKIGRTTNLKQRLSALNCSNPFDEDVLFYAGVIETVDSISTERYLHQLLDRFRYHREWFQMPQRQLYKIIQLVKDHQTTLVNLVDRVPPSDGDQMPLSDFKQLNIVHNVNLGERAGEAVNELFTRSSLEETKSTELIERFIQRHISLVGTRAGINVDDRVYDLYNLLPDEWFIQVDLLEILIHAIRLEPMVEESRMSTMRRLLMERRSYVDEVYLNGVFASPLTTQDKKDTLTKVCKVVKRMPDDQYQKWNMAHNLSPEVNEPVAKTVVKEPVVVVPQEGGCVRWLLSKRDEYASAYDTTEHMYTNDEIYEEYKTWAESRRADPLVQPIFNKEMNQYGFPMKQKKERQADGRRATKYHRTLSSRRIEECLVEYI